MSLWITDMNSELTISEWRYSMMSQKKMHNILNHLIKLCDMLIWRWLQSKNKRRTMQLLSNSSAASDCDCSSSTTANESTRTELFSRCRWCMSLKYLRGHSYRSVSHIYTRNHVLSNSVYVRHVFIACFKRIQLKQKITKRWNTKKREYTHISQFFSPFVCCCVVQLVLKLLSLSFDLVVLLLALHEMKLVSIFFLHAPDLSNMYVHMLRYSHTTLAHFDVTFFYIAVFLASFDSILNFIVRITARYYVFHSCLVFISLLRLHLQFLLFFHIKLLVFAVVNLWPMVLKRLPWQSFFFFGGCLRWPLTLVEHSEHFISKAHRENEAASQLKWFCPNRL